MLFKLLETNIFHKNVVTFSTLGPIYLVKTVKFGIKPPLPSHAQGGILAQVYWPKCTVSNCMYGMNILC